MNPAMLKTMLKNLRKRTHLCCQGITFLPRLRLQKLLSLLGLSFCGLLLSSLVQAGGLETLKNYLKNTRSLRANFHQVVNDSKGQKLQEVSGQVQIQRPNQFRWDYTKPYQQQIVSNGEEVWLYDPELQQVSIYSLKKALGNTPAALLASGDDVESNFTIKEITRKGHLEWVLVTPKTQDGDINRVFLGFENNLLREMILHDAFGQTTNIVFSNLETNLRLRADTFLFTTPKGVDEVRP